MRPQTPETRAAGAGCVVRGPGVSERTREWMRRVRALGDVGAHRRLSPVMRVRVRVLSSESRVCGVRRAAGAGARRRRPVAVRGQREESRHRSAGSERERESRTNTNVLGQVLRPTSNVSAPTRRDRMSTTRHTHTHCALMNMRVAQVQLNHSRAGLWRDSALIVLPPPRDPFPPESLPRAAPGRAPCA